MVSNFSYFYSHIQLWEKVVSHIKINHCADVLFLLIGYASNTYHSLYENCQIRRKREGCWTTSLSFNMVAFFSVRGQTMLLLALLKHKHGSSLNLLLALLYVLVTYPHLTLYFDHRGGQVMSFGERWGTMLIDDAHTREPMAGSMEQEEWAWNNVGFYAGKKGGSHSDVTAFYDPYS